MHNQPTTPTQNTWSVAFGLFNDDVQSVIDKVAPKKQLPKRDEKKRLKEAAARKNKAEIKRIVIALSEKGRKTTHIEKVLNRVGLCYLNRKCMIVKISRIRRAIK